MIYEACILVRPAADAAGLENVQKIIEEVVAQYEGEVLLKEDWGQRTLAQATSDGERRGHYKYYIFNSKNDAINEINRRLKINEDVMKSLIVKLGAEKNKEAILKSYKNPFNRDDEQNRFDMAKERKAFIRKKSCWFTANKIKADWKDPSSFQWLLNEFGKISPARVSGISAKHQTFATTAIKRARNIGLVSAISSRSAH